MNKTIAWRAFSKYLHDKGYSDFSENGNPSTTYNYSSRVDKVCKDEGFSNWDDFALHINDIIAEYGESGIKSEIGAQSHGSVLKALELFREFYVVFDALD